MALKVRAKDSAGRDRLFGVDELLGAGVLLRVKHTKDEYLTLDQALVITDCKVQVQDDGGTYYKSLFDTLTGVNGTTAVYFVSNSGSDAANGLTPSTAWQTCSKVNGFSFTAKNAILFKRGDSWAETITVPRSALTFGAYGGPIVYDQDGYHTNGPLLDGGAFVTSWSTYSGGAEVREVVDDFTGTAGVNLTSHTPNVGVSWAKTTGVGYTNTDLVITDANRIRRNGGVNSIAQYYANPVLGSDDYYVSADVIVKTTDTDFLRVIARGFDYKDSGYLAILGGASGSLTLAKSIAGTLTNFTAGPFTTVAAALGSYTAGTTYRLRIEVSGNTITGYIGLADGSPLIQFNQTTDTSIPDGDRVSIRLGSGTAAAATNSTCLHIDHVEQGPLGVTGNPVNTFQATVNTRVYLVDMDSTLSLKGANADQLTNGQWFWVGNVLYVRRDAGIPTNTTVIRGSLDYGINLADFDDATVQDIQFMHQNQRAIHTFTSAQRMNCRRLMIQRSCNADQGNNGCVGVYGPQCSVTNCVIRNVNNDGIFGQPQNGDTPQITDNLIGPVSGFGADCIHFEGATGTIGGYVARNTLLCTNPDTPKGCLILFGDGWVIEDNYLQGSGVNNGNTGNYGVSMVGDHNTVRRNFFYNVVNDAIRSTSNDGLGTRTDHVYHHNVMIDCGQGIGIRLASTAFQIYANTIINSARTPVFASVTDYMVHAYNTVTGNFTNNIVYNANGSGGVLCFDANAGGLRRENNLLGPEATGFVSDNSTVYNTLAAYSAGKSQDTSSISRHPGFRVLASSSAASYVPPSGASVVGAGTAAQGYTTSTTIGAYTPSGTYT